MSNTSVRSHRRPRESRRHQEPFSDKEIVELLEKRGIPIARRTVAKCRGELNILPSNMRKKCPLSYGDEEGMACEGNLACGRHLSLSFLSAAKNDSSGTAGASDLTPSKDMGDV